MFLYLILDILWLILKKNMQFKVPLTFSAVSATVLCPALANFNFCWRLPPDF
jgi:hypothetical protein